jgi:hypothetical protein
VQTARYLSFEEARRVVRQLGLKKTKQWWEWSREHRPALIPSSPHKMYAGKGWVSMVDWLGIGDRFLEFEEARAIVRKAGLKSVEQWQQWCRAGHRPANVPSNPNLAYAGKGFVSMPDFMGYGKRETR